MYIVNDPPAKVNWENGQSSKEIFGHMDEKKNKPLSEIAFIGGCSFSVQIIMKKTIFSYCCQNAGMVDFWEICYLFLEMA